MAEQAVSHRSLIDTFRDGAWLSRERILLWARAFAGAWVILFIFDFITHSTHGVMDAQGEHIGRDFINYWSGAKEALLGQAAALYDLNKFHDYQVSLVGPLSEWKMYSYPPTLLLLTMPLAFLSFLPALFVWSAAGLGACTAMIRRLTGWAWPLCLLAAFVPPASMWNLLAGQNGFLTAGLLCGGLMLLDRRPDLAGILFGLLCYKPQFGILLPVALLAGRHWRAFIAAGATVVIVAGLTALLFGLDSWLGFLHQMHIQRAMMEMKRWFRMPTVFGALHVMYVPSALAYAAQAVSTVCAIGAIAVIWRSRAATAVKGAALCIAIFLATPYAWDYDMIVLTFAVIWLYQDALKTGFLPWERFTWLLLLILPTPLMSAAQFLSVQPAPFILWFALILTLRRARLPRAVTP